MAYLRFNIDLAFKQPLEASLQADIKSFKTALLKIKPFAVKINAAAMNEENTQMSKQHICKHDEGKPCEEKVDISSIAKS